MVDGVPMSALVAAVPDPRAVIVAIHGGATTSAYFDCPGHPRLSLLRMAAAHGYHRDRPRPARLRRVGAVRRRDDATPTGASALAFGVVDKILGETDPRRRASSCSPTRRAANSALRMAVDEPGGRRARRRAGRHRAALQRRGEGHHQRQATLTSSPAGLRDLLWQPTELYPPEVLTGAPVGAGRRRTRPR